MKSLQSKITSLEKELFKSQSVTIQTKSQQKDIEKDKKFKEASNKKTLIDLEQKLKFMTTEMKRQETRADKISEQMRKIIDAKIGFANGADIY